MESGAESANLNGVEIEADVVPASSDKAAANWLRTSVGRSILQSSISASQWGAG
jgi:hypothetical protein